MKGEVILGSNFLFKPNNSLDEWIASIKNTFDYKNNKSRENASDDKKKLLEEVPKVKIEIKFIGMKMISEFGKNKQ